MENFAFYVIFYATCWASCRWKSGAEISKCIHHQVLCRARGRVCLVETSFAMFVSIGTVSSKCRVEYSHSWANSFRSTKTSSVRSWNCWKGHVNPSAQPIFCRAHSIPYSMRVKFEAELDRLVQAGVLEVVQFSSWIAPIVPVLKADKLSVWICRHFKLTVNQTCKLDQYPIPRTEDLFATLSGGKTFSKLAKVFHS